MIKIVRIEPAGEQTLRLHFSDGSSGEWSAAELIARDTELTRPLSDAAYFARAFVEAGALAWPNGLEFSPWGLHGQLEANGALRKEAA